MTLARLAALHARHEFEQGHWEAGWDDVDRPAETGPRTWRWAPNLSAALVGYRDRDDRDRGGGPLPAGVEIGPPRDRVRRPGCAAGRADAPANGPRGEANRVGLADPGAEGGRTAQGRLLARRLEKFVDLPDRAGAEPTGTRSQSVKTFEQAIKMLEDLLPFYDRAGEDGRPCPGRSSMPSTRSSSRRRRPPARWPAPPSRPWTEIVAPERRNQTQMALFKAAIAVVQGGPDRLKDIKDPFGDGPFEYRALDKGFELKSKLLFKGQPVTLTVGKEKNGVGGLTDPTDRPTRPSRRCRVGKAGAAAPAMRSVRVPMPRRRSASDASISSRLLGLLGRRLAELLDLLA